MTICTICYGARMIIPTGDYLYVPCPCVADQPETEQGLLTDEGDRTMGAAKWWEEIYIGAGFNPFNWRIGWEHGVSEFMVRLGPFTMAVGWPTKDQPDD